MSKTLEDEMDKYELVEDEKNIVRLVAKHWKTFRRGPLHIPPEITKIREISWWDEEGEEGT